MGKDYGNIEGWSLQQPAIKRKFQKLRKLQALREAKQKKQGRKKYPQAGRCNYCGKDYERINPVNLKVCRRCALRVREITGFKVVNRKVVPCTPISRHPNITKELCYLCGRERESHIYAASCEICDKCKEAVEDIYNTKALTQEHIAVVNTLFIQISKDKYFKEKNS